MLNELLKIEKDPDGGYNYGGGYFDSLDDVLAMGILGFCGCGRPDDALRLIINIMKTRAFPDKDLTVLDFRDTAALVRDNAEVAAYIIFYLLDEKGLTEHGSSVPGWLTAKGEAFVKAYDTEHGMA